MFNLSVLQFDPQVSSKESFNHLNRFCFFPFLFCVGQIGHTKTYSIEVYGIFLQVELKLLIWRRWTQFNFIIFFLFVYATATWWFALVMWTGSKMMMFFPNVISFENKGFVWTIKGIFKVKICETSCSKRESIKATSLSNDRLECKGRIIIIIIFLGRDTLWGQIKYIFM